MKTNDVACRQSPNMLGWSPDRFGGWVGRRYGPITFLYETNSQAPDRHLNLAETKGIGRVFVDSISTFLATDTGKSLLADVDTRRRERAQRWAARKQDIAADANAIDAEAVVSKTIGLKVKDGDNSLIENWIP
jgi:hypothetical protein